jgi:polyphosphate kinase
VLHEALDERTPLLERVKFRAISPSNLDEFFMKRIALIRPMPGDSCTQAKVRSLGLSGKTFSEGLVPSAKTTSQTGLGDMFGATRGCSGGG